MEPKNANCQLENSRRNFTGRMNQKADRLLGFRDKAEDIDDLNKECEKKLYEKHRRGTFKKCGASSKDWF